MLLVSLGDMLHRRPLFFLHTGNSLEGNSQQILLSEMSLPGIEALIEKLVRKILGRLGKENPSCIAL